MVDTILRLGNDRYCTNRDWAKMPMGKEFSSPSGIAISNEGKIFILQRSDPFMLVFNNDGHLVDEWTNPEVGDGHYIYIAMDGRVFITDRDHHRILIFNQTGEQLGQIGYYDQPSCLGAPFNHPTDVTMNQDGTIFVSDGYGNYCVHHLTLEGELINSWGSRPGNGNGEFLLPHSILLDQKGRVVVADRENNRIQYFNQYGKFLMQITGLFRPIDIAEDLNGLIYVTDHAFRINVYNSEAELISSCSTQEPIHGLAVSANGDVFIIEMSRNLVTKLEKI